MVGGELRGILDKSFSAIKKDMHKLRTNLANAKKEIEELKDGIVTKDKINIVKIRIGEINEELKKIWDLQNQVKKLEQSLGNKEKELKRQLASKKDVSAELDFLRKDATKEFGSIIKELERINKKEFVPKKDFDKEIKELDNSLESVEKQLEAERGVQEPVFNKRMKQVELRIKRLSDMGMTEKQAKILVDDVNQEFDDVHKNLKEINNLNTSLKKQIESIKADFVSKKQFEKEKKAISARILDFYNRVLSKIGKGKPSKWYITSTIIIIISFILILLSIASFFFNKVFLMDKFAISAVGCFIVGMIIRIVTVIKRKE